MRDRIDVNMLVIFSITLTAVLGVSSITPAFPKMIEELKISEKSIGLLITVFTLPGIFLTPVLGILADRFGRKKIIIPSLLLFGTAGTSCFFARDFNILLTLRFLQGFGAAALGSLNLTLIGDIYCGKRKTAVMGYNISVLQVGIASYPAIGGALAMIGWYYPFLLPLLAIPAAFFVLFYLDNPEPENNQRLNEYIKNAWESINNKKVITLFISGVSIFIVIYGTYLTYFPILLVKKFNSNTLEIGLMMSCLSVSTAISSFQVGKISKIYPEKKLLIISYLVGFACMLLIPFANRIWNMAIVVIIYGFSQGVNIPTMMTILTNLAPIETRGVFMSLNGSIIRMGQTIGPILVGTVYGTFGLNATFFMASFVFLFIAGIIYMAFR